MGPTVAEASPVAERPAVLWHETVALSLRRVAGTVADAVKSAGSRPSHFAEGVVAAR
ncbi:hypothetical protein [Streptomyces sp. NPDC057496]|uniref:hypothetical protein n=1 Tax=Streptomyces sp. NPDC057496 TaxID=3346149 RepID=UPI003694DE08